MMGCGRAAPAWLQVVGGLWAVWALVAPRPVGGYNLSPAHSRRMDGPPNSHFGFSVALWSDDASVKRVVVGAPRGRNGTSGRGQVTLGNIFFCDVDGPVVCRPDARLPTVSTADFSEAALNVLGDPQVTAELEEKKAGLGRPKNVMGFGHSLSTLKQDVSLLAACAPRYPRYESASVEVRGACFVRTSPDSDPKTHLPFPHRTPILNTIQNAMLGFSAALDDTGSYVVMGGPTAFNGEGMVFSSSIKARGGRPANRLSSGLQEPKNLDHTDSYEGWALVLGNFDNGSHSIAVSTVNYGSYIGRVNIYPKAMTANIRPIYTVYGQEVGAHFGYCLGSADVDGDGAADLLVGAPLSAGGVAGSLLPDAGKVYVYYAPMVKAVDKRPPTQLTGVEAWGRFGAAITSLGDIDQDEYHDIAVAAPYAGVNGQGAVYVFNGGVDGLRLPHSQVIEASIFSGMMRGFGFSLDGGLDIDDNGYPDLIIGAVESDTALLIRSAPVIRLVGSVTFASETIMAEDNSCEVEAAGYRSFKGVCFNLEVDLTYDTHKKFNDLRMQFKIVLKGPEDNSLFGFKINNDHRYAPVRTVNFRDKRSPWSVQAFYKRVRSNIGQSLSASVTVSLVPAADDGKDEVTIVPPVLDAASATFTTNTTLLCHDNTTCFAQPDLQIVAYTRPVTLGKDLVEVEVELTVKDDPGYKVEVEIRHPEGLEFQRVEGEGRIPSCSYHQLVNQIADSLTCIFEFIDADEMESFTLHFAYDAAQMLAYLTSRSSSALQLTLGVTSDTEAETNAHNNHVTVSVPVVLKAILYTKAYSVLESATVVVNQTTSSQELQKAKKDPDTSFPVNKLGPHLLHEFSLTNRGPSPVFGARLVFQLPLYHDDQLLTYHMEQPTVIPSQVTCSILPANPFHLQPSVAQETGVFKTTDSDSTTVGPDNTTVFPVTSFTPQDTLTDGANATDGREIRRRHVLPQEYDEAAYMLTNQSVVASPAPNHTTQLRDKRLYSKDDHIKPLFCNLTKCILTCEVGLLEAEATVSVSFSSHLITAAVSEMPVRSVSVASEMLVEVKQTNTTIINPRVTAVTQIFLQKPQKPQSFRDVPLWILLLAVAFAVLLVILIVFGLSKAGFFKRNRPPTAPKRKSLLQPSTQAVTHSDYEDD
nr:integrin alpha-5-like [Procambarus clarkii]XP_045614778.1 integrin alpha-5-like [Procambarus clarkii]XP_045614779.1 integrin alpha-5-like [Procambarus clarkii]